MNINSQYSSYPNQPDNPTDLDRYTMLQYALEQRGWPQDINRILKILTPPQPITDYAKPGTFLGTKVGIIGGGLAGLSAAYELRKLGYDITIFDALEDRVGGRVYTYSFKEQPDVYNEFGPMRIPIAHETVWHYLNLFGLPTKPFIQYNPNGYVYIKGVRVRNDRNGESVSQYIYPKYNLTERERNLSWQELLNIGIDNNLALADKESRSETIQVKKKYSKKALEWINRSNLCVMQKSGLSQGAIDLVSNFIPLLEGNLYNSFIDYVQEDYPANLSYLYEIPGGMKRLPLSFYASFFNDYPYREIPPALTGSVLYKSGHYVNGIHLDGEQKVIINYENIPAKEIGNEAFDYVVCAIPFSTLRNVDINPLFSDLKMRAIREVNYIASQKSLVLFRERFWEREGIVGGASFTDLPIGSIWYPSDHTPYLDDINSVPWSQPGVAIGSFNFGLDTTRLDKSA